MLHEMLLIVPRHESEIFFWRLFHGGKKNDEIVSCKKISGEILGEIHWSESDLGAEMASVNVSAVLKGLFIKNVS